MMCIIGWMGDPPMNDGFVMTPRGEERRHD